uniref:Sulfofructose kinase n=1 Tax=Candidatus Kentrum sp. DK TaxID=2126562 RepID=A0A450TC18_9GAMM|nr:MAG: sulfofructose kinase [Candidatus Kentron sp. DK]VFJ64309.1 MAG: sulfofructose kinase [Candidatus Kentron sp. DK]
MAGGAVREMDVMVMAILIIGSVAWDEVVFLDAPLRIGSHNAGSEKNIRIGGGAANTAMALAAMASVGPEAKARVEPVVISSVGGDSRGKALLTALEECGVRVDYVDCRGTRTTRSLVLLDRAGERTVVNIERAPVPLPPDLADIPAECLYARSADPALRPILEKRARRGDLVIAHIPPTMDDFRPARILVGSASDLDQEFLADPFRAGRRIAGGSLKWVVITHGAIGASAHGNHLGNEVILREPAPKVSVRDSTGAGDVFAAGLAFALTLGKKMPEALATAVRWGSASVEYEGTVPPSS